MNKLEDGQCRFLACILQDLLQPQNNDLQIREGEDGVFVAGVHEVEVKKVEDCLHLLQVGDRNRSVPWLTLQTPVINLDSLAEVMPTRPVLSSICITSTGSL